MRVSRLTQLLLICSAAAQAESRRPVDLEIDKADAIVTGEIQSGYQKGSSASFVLLAGTLLNVSMEDLFVLQSRHITQQLNRELKGYFGIWFLKSEKGAWRWLSPVGGQLIFEASFYPVPRGAVALAGGASPADHRRRLAGANRNSIGIYVSCKLWRPGSGA